MKAIEIKEQKRKEAEARNEKWRSLSFEKQIAHLDNLFGKDKGAAKQRAKIALAIATAEQDVKTGKAKGKQKKAKKAS